MCAYTRPVRLLPNPTGGRAIEQGGMNDGGVVAKNGPRGVCRYTMIEKDQKGHIDKDECTARGLPPGPLYKDLKNGLPVVLPDGVVLRPEEVVGPDLCGRKVVVLGDTCDPSGIAQVAKGADLLVHEATFDSSIPVRRFLWVRPPRTGQAGRHTRYAHDPVNLCLPCIRLVVGGWAFRLDQPRNERRAGGGRTQLCVR